jgi:hypothetical protein
MFASREVGSGWDIMTGLCSTIWIVGDSAVLRI